MKLYFTPVDMLSTPNDFTEVAQWHVTAGTAETLWLRLKVSDSLGDRRYIPAAGSGPTLTTLKVTFMRARNSTLGAVDTAQTFEVSATALSDDRSLWSFPLTAAQVNLLTSGTVKVTLTVGGASGTVYTMNKGFAIKKTLTSSGC
jgi:hypothetical protein